MSKSAKAAAKGQPSLDDFLDKRDYMGALTLLEFKLRCQDGDMKDLLMWIGYCAFHLGAWELHCICTSLHCSCRRDR